MENIRAPQRANGHNARNNECRETLSTAFHEFVNSAISAGWHEKEVAVAMADIADDFVMELYERKKTHQAEAKPC